jgi:hypothetical protein
MSRTPGRTLKNSGYVRFTVSAIDLCHSNRTEAQPWKGDSIGICCKVRTVTLSKWAALLSSDHGDISGVIGSSADAGNIRGPLGDDFALMPHATPKF